MAMTDERLAEIKEEQQISWDTDTAGCIAEIERLQAENTRLQTKADATGAENVRLKRELAETREALQYYAHPENWPELPWHPGIACPSPTIAIDCLKEAPE